MAAAINQFSLHWADILVLVLYFAVVIGFGMWVSLNEIVNKFELVSIDLC